MMLYSLGNQASGGLLYGLFGVGTKPLKFINFDEATTFLTVLQCEPKLHLVIFSRSRDWPYCDVLCEGASESYLTANVFTWLCGPIGSCRF